VVDPVVVVVMVVMVVRMLVRLQKSNSSSTRAVRDKDHNGLKGGRRRAAPAGDVVVSGRDTEVWLPCRGLGETPFYFAGKMCFVAASEVTKADRLLVGTW
jgi:hypothetical protein